MVVRQIDPKTDGIVEEYSSLAAAAYAVSGSSACIHQCVTGKRALHRGWAWERDGGKRKHPRKPSGKMVVCGYCKREFYKAPHTLARSTGHYCSKVCDGARRRKR